MEPTEILGYVAATLTTVCYMPQVWQTYKTKDVTGISLGMYVALTAGVGLWFIYSLLLKLTPLAICNGLCLLMIIAILAMKLAYSKKPVAIADAA